MRQRADLRSRDACPCDPAAPQHREKDSDGRSGVRLKTPRLRRWLWAIVVSVLQLSSPVAAETQSATLLGATMGTTYRVTVPALRGSRSVLKAHIDELLVRINGQMSTYQADSELSRLNANTSSDWLPVSVALFTVLTAAQTVSVASDGAFDITVGPAVNLWGFGVHVQRAEPPAADVLAAARAQIGYRQLELTDGPPRVRKARADLSLDLSAIAKGYAVDQVAALLEREGWHDFLIDIGGEMRAAGQRAQGRPWRVGVALPVAERDALERVLPLTDSALATSGDYRNFFEHGGQRYAHTIDPATGQPLRNGVASVSVLHSSCMLADAYATALMVLGPQRGLALAMRQHFEALVLVHDSNDFTAHATPGFPAPR